MFLLCKSLVLMQDPVTDAPAVLVFVHNITQQKQMESQLAQRQEALQRCASSCLTSNLSPVTFT